MLPPSLASLSRWTDRRLIVSRFSISTAACDVDMLANEEGEGVQEGEVAINVDDAIDAAEAGNGWRGNKVPPW